jgi:hypothetical protein
MKITCILKKLETAKLTYGGRRQEIKPGLGINIIYGAIGG